MKILLIRHGRTDANEKRLYCGLTDLPLSNAGIAELSKSNRNIDGYRIVTSGMKRCEMTLAALFGDLPHDIDPRLREMDFGAFELRSYEEMKNDADYIAWISGDNEANVTPNGESGNQMKLRALSAFDDILADGCDTIIITHGGPIAAIMERLFPCDGKNRYEWQPKPGRGYLVELPKKQYQPI